MKVLKFLGKFLGSNKEGEQGGILSIISEKTGKISFRRSVPIVILTTIVAPDIAQNGLTWLNLAALAIAGGIYVLPQLLKKT